LWLFDARVEPGGYQLSTINFCDTFRQLSLVT
jgi:hypothetical protein